MLPSFFRDTITRIRPSTQTVRGTVIPDWDSAATLDIGGCSVQPASTSLSEDGRILGIADLYTLFAPPSSDIQTGDRIQFNGKVYTIDGEVRVQPSANSLDHIQISLRRYHG